MNDGELKIKVTLDETSANKHMDSLGQKADALSNKFKNAGKGLTMGLTLPIVGLGVASVKMASDLDETINKVNVSFGDSAQGVKNWAKTSIKSMGLAQQTALDSAALFGDMGTGMGIAEDGAADMAMELTQLSADLASFKNVRQDVASTALKGIFTGETESLKGLGIVMTETNLEEFRRVKKIKKTIDKMTQAEKVQLRYQFVMEKTSKAQGDFARTSDGMANQSRMAGEKIKELSTQMGAILLPIALKLVTGLSSVVSWFSQLTDGQKKTILIILGVIAVMGPLLVIFGNLITVIKGVSLALNFLAMNPIVLVIGAIIIAIILLVKHFDKVKWAANEVAKAFMTSFNWLKTGLWNIFKGITNMFNSMINNLVGGINFFVKNALTPLNVLIDGMNGILEGLGQKKIKNLTFSIPKIPMLDVGTNMVQGDGLAFLHQGEAVVPKKYNPAAGGSGINGMTTIYVQQPNIELDGRVVSRGLTPYITQTVKLGGGNL